MSMNTGNWDLRIAGYLFAVGHLDGLVQDCSNSSASALELPVLHWAIDLVLWIYLLLFSIDNDGVLGT